MTLLSKGRGVFKSGCWAAAGAARATSAASVLSGRIKSFSSELYYRPRLELDGLVMDELGGRHVFYPKSQRFKQGDLIRRLPPAQLAQHQLADLAADVIVPDSAFLLGYQEIARLIQGGFAPVHEQLRFDDGR